MVPIKWRVHRKMRGYTLIELLVTITIVVLVTGTSMSAYLTFNENKRLDVDARNLNTLLNKIRSKAVFLEYPDGCTGLTNFAVSTALNTDGLRTVVRYLANCSEGIVAETTEDILESSTFTADFSLVFLPLTGKLESSADEEITIQSIKGVTKTKRVTINQFFGTNNIINNEE